MPVKASAPDGAKARLVLLARRQFRRQARASAGVAYTISQAPPAQATACFNSVMSSDSSSVV